MNNEPRTAQSADELEKHLEEEIAHLQYLCDGYDAGNQALAKKMAASLRLLLHDTKQSKGLLGLCGVLPDAEFFNAGSEERIDHLMVGSSLTGMEMGEGTSVSLTYDSTPGAKQKVIPLRKIEGSGRYRVLHAFEMYNFPQDKEPADDTGENLAFFRLHGRRRARRGLWLPFDTWWTHNIWSTVGGEKFSRKDLVLEVANTDGGAHVDSGLRNWYARLTRDNSTGYVVGIDGVDGAPEPEIWATIRAIAQETLMSIRKHRAQDS
jgi:hypothetical protein